MPTTLHRIQVTETPALARALERAEHEWPGLPKSELVTRLAEEGGKTVEARGAWKRERRLAAVARTAGVLPQKTYPTGYLEALREDWPE